MPLEFREEKLRETLDGIEPLANLRALEVMAAVQAGAQDEMSLLKRARADENIEYLFLDRIHGDDAAGELRKNKIILRGSSPDGRLCGAVSNPVPLEDELGDVLEKAMRHAGLNEDTLGRRAAVAPGRIRDAINYRPELSSDELRRLATVLGLNEVGLCALACGRYPLPSPAALPFALHPLRMRHGIGVANAYVVAEHGANRGVLFDTGPCIETLEAVWPPGVREVDAVFLTHAEGEHAGGLCPVVERFRIREAYCPRGAKVACGEAIEEGEKRVFGNLAVRAFSTPGHAPAHNCYLVEARSADAGAALLVCGDLFFAGSVGGAQFCRRQLAANLRRMLESVPPETVIAPGHGPLTTVENELRYNPFVL